MQIGRISFFFSLSVITLFPSSSVFAQEKDQDVGMETIVVSTNRHSSDLRDATSNISALSNEQISLISPVHINESLVRIPGVWISRGNGQEHLTAIRSPVLTGAGSCGAFYMAEDGIGLRAPGFCNANQLFGVNSEQAERIEVIRGPNSTLYGANAMHGVLNVITPDVFNLPDFSLQGEIGGHDYLRTQFVASRNMEAQGVALYGNLSEDGGYKDDSGFEQQKINAVHQLNSSDFSVKNYLSFTNLNQETAGFVQGFEAYKDADLKTSNPNPEAYRDSQSVRAYSQWKFEQGEDSYWQVTPYFRYHDMQFLMHFLPWQPLETNGHRSIGVQSQYYHELNELQVTAGLDLDWTEGWLSEVQADNFAPHLPQGVHYDYEVDALNWSPFLNVDWQITPNFKGTMGLRFDKMRYQYNTQVPAGSACAPDVDNCRFTRPESQDVSFGDWSYKVGINYQWLQNHHFYSQYSLGFRPPQATELFRLQAGQQIANLDSEQLKAFELGLRGIGKRWFYELTWFDMSKDNHIFQDTQRQNIDNGQTDHQGLEVATKWHITPHWYVGAGAAFTEHHYANDIQISRSGSIQGNEIDTAPDKTANIRLGWNKDGNSWELEWVVMGEYYLNPENTAKYDGHDIVNLRGGWQINSQWQLSWRLLNLLDEDYAERADFAFGNYRYFVGEPRSMYIALKYSI